LGAVILTFWHPLFFEREVELAGAQGKYSLSLPDSNKPRNMADKVLLSREFKHRGEQKKLAATEKDHFKAQWQPILL